MDVKYSYSSDMPKLLNVNIIYSLEISSKLAMLSFY